MDHTRSRAIASTTIPVQQHLKHVALKAMLRSPALNQTNQTSSAHDIPIKQPFLQSAALLPLQYSRYLDHETAAKDFIFATADIFLFAAYAEIQCLNLLQLLINDIVGQRPHTQGTLLEGEPEPTYTLLEYKTILDQHQQRLEETLATLRRRGHSGWPRADKEPQRRKADNQARRLEEDYQYLVMRTRQLAAACQEGVTMLTNRVVINEAKKAMEQTERMKKLTMLATFFIPLSFTSSVFGMNFKEFGNQSVLSIWIWVVVTVPIVFMTAVIYLWDMSMLRKRLAWFTKRRPHVLEKQV
jgi:CorA-like Mg2+ transporter protein